jgi:hypothetical protein
MNLLISIGLEEPLRVGAVGLVAPQVRSHIVRRNEPYGVPEWLKLPRPIVRGPAGLHEDGCPWPLSEELEEAIAREPVFFVDAARLMRNGDLKHRFCEIDGDGRMLHADSSLPWPREAIYRWHMMPHGGRSPFHRLRPAAAGARMSRRG